MTARPWEQQPSRGWGSEIVQHLPPILGTDRVGNMKAVCRLITISAPFLSKGQNDGNTDAVSKANVGVTNSAAAQIIR